MSLARAAETRDEYLEYLRVVVTKSLERVCESGDLPESITLHIPKEAGKEERNAVKEGVSKARGVPSDTRIRIVRVNESPDILAVDPDDINGVPNRGTVIQIGDNDFVVYTEGREEQQTWRQRTPTCLRVMPQDVSVSPGEASELVAQAYRMSQVNWRAFNAGSRPVTTFYGSLIAKVISHVPGNMVNELYNERAHRILENRMWFL